MCLYKKEKQEKFPEAILMMICEYRAQGIFNVISIDVDKAFDSIKSKLENEQYKNTLLMCGINQHIEVIERIIQFVNERIHKLCLGSHIVHHHFQASDD